MSDGWYYMKDNLFGCTREGPLSTDSIQYLAFQGLLKPKTLVCNPAGQWMAVSQVPMILDKIEKGKQHRQLSKVIAKGAAKAERHRILENKRRAQQEAAEAAQVPITFAEPEPPHGAQVINPAQGWRCPYCQSTKGIYKQSTLSNVGCLTVILLIFLCFPFCWVGLFMRDEVTTCQSCGMKLG